MKLGNTFKNFNYDKILTVLVVWGVIIYLVYLSLPDIYSFFNNSRQIVSYTKSEMVFLKFQEYINDNPKLYAKYEGATYCITLAKLKKLGYIEGDVTNPNNLEKLPDKTVLEAKYNNKEFIISYNNFCEER